MKILFSPSETKTESGTGNKIDKESFIFEELYEKRVAVLQKYQEFIDSADEESLCSLFGIKDIDRAIEYRRNIFELATQKAVRRYAGTAYEYLQYDSLKREQQEYIDENTVIFSNLFGPIGAGDLIPDYRFKQGSKLPSFNIEQHYKEHFSKPMDYYLAEHILDLRAAFYQKFYAIKVPYISFKFLKDGKMVSHWAKAYRGVILKEISKYQPQDYDDLKTINFNDLKLIEIQKKSLNEIWVMEIE